MKHVDLFSGFGGFSHALALAWPEAETIFGIDNSEYAVAVAKRHFGDRFTCDDLLEFNMRKIPSADLLTAGIPCEWCARFRPKKDKKKDSERGQAMLRSILGACQSASPDHVLIQAAMSFSDSELYAPFIDSLESCGYNVLDFKMNSKDYGLAQNRNALYILGSRGADLNGIEKLLHSVKKNRNVKAKHIIEPASEVDPRCWLHTKKTEKATSFDKSVKLFRRDYRKYKNLFDSNNFYVNALDQNYWKNPNYVRFGKSTRPILFQPSPVSGISFGLTWPRMMCISEGEKAQGYPAGFSIDSPEDAKSHSIYKKKQRWIAIGNAISVNPVVEIFKTLKECI